MAGQFIVLDGTEGCGKSTQAKMLAERMAREGDDAILVRDPGTSRLGEKIRGLLLNPENTDMAMRCEMLLYMAARAQLMAEIIGPALAAGKSVVCDRFVSSTLAYQLGRRRNDSRGDPASGRGGDPRAVARPDHRAGYASELSMARVRRPKDRIEQRPAAYHEQVRQNYLAQAAAHPDAYQLVSAAGTIDEIHSRIWNAVRQRWLDHAKK